MLLIEYTHALALGTILLGRALHQLKMFKPTRYLIEMITRVVSDMTDFLVILFLSIAMFTILFSRFSYVAARYGD